MSYQYPNVTHSIYYRVVPRFLRKCPFVFWGGISVILAAVALFLLWESGESLSIEAAIAFFGLFALIPMSHIGDYQRFYKLMESFIKLFELDSKEREHIWTKLNKIFALKNPIMWGTSISINVVCTAVLMHIGLPLMSNLLNVLVLIGFEIVVFFGGQSVYTTLADLHLLNEFASISPRTHFFKSFSPRLREFCTNYYLSSSLHILSIYVAVLVMVIRGPYGTPPVLMLLLVVVALLPTVYVVYFLHQIHRIMLVIKQRNLEILDRKIGSYWESSFEKEPIESKILECLEKLLELREKVEQMSEWPWDISGSIGFLISTGVSMAQIVFTILNL
jgi:hypothetical protein